MIEATQEPTSNWAARARNAGRWLTVQQWRSIDDEFGARGGFDARTAAVLLTAAVSLVLARFSNRPESWAAVHGALPWLDGLPRPDLHPHLFWALGRVVNYCVLPMLCTKLVLKRSFREIGVRFVFEPKIWLLYGAMASVAVGLAYFASHTHSFLRVYPKYPNAGESLAGFLCWEFAYGLQFVALEFFFRGFLIFSLARHIGSLALFVMVIPYAMIHFSKPFAECLGSILAGLTLGTIALRTGSIWGGVAVHCVVAWSMDIFALWQLGKLGGLL